MAKHVFLSFVAEDLDLVTLFRGQAKNRSSSLTFDDYSVRSPYNSINASYIKSRIRVRIQSASILTCLIGTQTYKSPCVGWGIQYAADQAKRLLGARLHGGSKNESTPSALTRNRAKVVNWDIDSIVKWIG
jgi:MTH538 TIR-like domain (DUF1863)